ncbi:hypothetical protein THH46_31685 [Pseudomonas sp. NA13]
MRRFLDGAERIVAASPNYVHTSDVLKEYPAKTRIITYGLNKTSYPQPDAARMAGWKAELGERFFCSWG